MSVHEQEELESQEKHLVDDENHGNINYEVAKRELTTTKF